MTRTVCLLALLLFCALQPHSAWAREPLIVGISANQAPPFITRQQGQISGGILKELMDELGQRLGLEVRYLERPRKRLKAALESGRIHLLPHTNPLWYPDLPQLLWSPPWLQGKDLFVVFSQRPLEIRTFADLHGYQVGAIRGYRYSDLDPLFEQQKVLRNDSSHLDQNFDKLAAGRVDALIDSEVMIDYYLKHHPNPEQFQKAQMIAARFQRFIALMPEAPCSIDALSSALQQMLDDGTVEQILMRYR